MKVKQAADLTVFIENRFSSGNAPSIGGDPGPQVSTLLGHWPCDG